MPQLSWPPSSLYSQRLIHPEAETTFEEKLAFGATRHGADGNSKMAGASSLAGQPAIFPVSQLILCRDGLRTSEQVRLSPLPSNHHDLCVVR